MIDHMVVDALEEKKWPAYHKSYPTWIDRTYVLSRRYKFLEFTKFSGEDKQSVVEHVIRSNIQCEEFRNKDFLNLKLFPYSLIGIAFNYFTKFAPNSMEH